MANKRYDVCTPRKGKDKTFWHRVGTAWENNKGIQVVFDSLPMPDAEGRCVVNLFEPREDNARPASSGGSGGWAANGSRGDDVPGWD